LPRRAVENAKVPASAETAQAGMGVSLESNPALVRGKDTTAGILGEDSAASTILPQSPKGSRRERKGGPEDSGGTVENKKLRHIGFAQNVG